MKKISEMRYKKDVVKIRYLEFNMAQLMCVCKDWAKEIKKDFCPDCIVFVAKSGFGVGKAFSEVFDCPLFEVSAKRKGGKLKDTLSPIVRILIPQKIVFKLLSSKKNMSYHEAEKERKILLGKRIQDYIKTIDKSKKILIVDDSVDTGHTVIQIKQEFQRLCPDINIYFASICKMSGSEKRIHIDYFLYENAIIFTCMSRLSKEYGAFLKNYEEWHNSFG
ncbi:MAG: phosphoribosyltransferase [Clostridium sp.]|nr:phosphoribosyltransferase [Clostridium sp.]